MTCCVGLYTKAGLVMLAGNLAVSQAVIGLLDEGLWFTSEDRLVMGSDAPDDPEQVQLR